MTPEQSWDYNQQIIVSVQNCARCQKNHQLIFCKFINPISDSDGTIWNYWAMCPNMYEPILLKVVEK